MKKIIGFFLNTKMSIYDPRVFEEKDEVTKKREMKSSKSSTSR